MTKRYGIIFFVSAIVLIGSLVGYGIYINSTSSAHVAKMAASQYFKVNGAKAMYREMSPVMYLPTVNIFSQKLSDVHFQLDGVVTNILVKPGDKVQAGQLIGEIVNQEMPSQILQAEGKIRSAEANVVRNGSLLKRYGELVEQGIVSRQQYDDTLSNLNASRGELDVAKAYQEQLSSRLAGQKVVAPFDGDVLKIYHAPGSSVRAGDSLLMIGDLSALFIRITISNEILDQLVPLSGEFRLAIQESRIVERVYDSNLNSSNTKDDKDFDVQIVQVNPPEDIPAQYRTVLFKIINSSGFLEPGTFYQTKIYGKDKRRILTIPRDS